MRYVRTSEIKPGMQIAIPLLDKDSRVLLHEGRKITERMIARIVELEIDGVYIDDAFSSDITISAAISSKLQTKIIRELKHMNVDAVVKNARVMVEEIMGQTDCINNLMIVKDFDNYTYQHSVSVGILSSMIGLTCGFTEDDIVNLTTAALLHDVGKAGIAADILNKAGKLTKEEKKIMDKHPELGYEMLKDYDSILSVVRVSILEHHENVDGSGYPKRLTGEKIHRFAQIIHIADVYDAMISKRAYKDEIHPENVITFIMSEAGKMFEPFYAEVFMKCVPVYPKGVTVQLSNGEKAVITHNYPENVLRPDIRLFDGRNISLITDRDYRSVVITGM